MARYSTVVDRDLSKSSISLVRVTFELVSMSVKVIEPFSWRVKFERIIASWFTWAEFPGSINIWERRGMVGRSLSLPAASSLAERFRRAMRESRARAGRLVSAARSSKVSMSVPRPARAIHPSEVPVSPRTESRAIDWTSGRDWGERKETSSASWSSMCV